MIIVVYVFLLCLGEYTGYKYDSTSFHIKDIEFRCGCSAFTETATEADLQSATFVAPTFTTQNNGVRGDNIDQKASGDPLLCSKAALLWHLLYLRDKNATPSTP